MRNDLYQLLDVTPSVTQDELKSAFRRQAKKFHPDRNGGDPAAEERFKAIVEAYRILSDPYERELYDADCERDRKYAGAPELAAMRRNIRVSARHGRERREDRANRRNQRERERERERNRGRRAYTSPRPSLFFLGRNRKVSMWHLLVFYAAAAALFVPAVCKSCQMMSGSEEQSWEPPQNDLSPEEIRARALDAIAQLRLQAEAGDAEAQFKLGLILYSGMGVEADRPAAHEWWQKAAANGHPKAADYLKRFTNTAPPPAEDTNPPVIRAAQPEQ